MLTNLKVKQSLAIVSVTSDLANTVEIIQPEDFEERKENKENEVKPRLQLFDISGEVPD